MNILIIGGTRFFGIHTVEALLSKGHQVTIATRGLAPDSFGDRVSRILFDRENFESIRKAFKDKHFDVVIDKIAYCSNHVRDLLEVIHCEKYILMSSTAVYQPLHPNTTERDFSPLATEVIWCSRDDFPYDTVKRHAEYALWQKYSDIPAIAVRYPYVIGNDDYTYRLLFYIEHTLKGIPMYIDNLSSQMGFINSSDAGKFMAFLVNTSFTGGINGCCTGTISIQEILDYVESKTGKRAILSPNGDAAPYNGTPDYSIDTAQASALGYEFSSLKDWIFDLIDNYITAFSTHS